MAVTDGGDHMILPASLSKEKAPVLRPTCLRWPPLRSVDNREGSQLQGPGDARWVNPGPHCIHSPGVGHGDAQRWGGMDWTSVARFTHTFDFPDLSSPAAWVSTADLQLSVGWTICSFILSSFSDIYRVDCSPKTGETTGGNDHPPASFRACVSAGEMK